MDLTPVRIRGKPKTKPKRRHPPTNSSESTKKTRKSSKLPTARPAMPTLQGLPQEILEMIFLYSMNIALPQCSPDLGRLLSHPKILMDYTLLSFFSTRELNRSALSPPRENSSPSFQSKLLRCRFFTYPFFLIYVQKAHTTLLHERGKAWSATGVAIPDASFFTPLWPYKFTQVNYLGFAEGFHIPEKLLHGPWTGDKASLLYVLVSFSGEIDWEGSMAGETAKEGLKEAIREENERAVAALSVLLGIAQAITTDILRLAVIQCGCNMSILRHLLYNAQILYHSASNSSSQKDLLDFHDPALWRWADEHSSFSSEDNEKGEGLKAMLRSADTFSLQFYNEPVENWTKTVPFPYGGAKFDSRALLNDTNKELLTRLYQSHGRRITRRLRGGTETISDAGHQWHVDT
ncbi:hypothetical protein GQ43DRAFT_444375 [Delitschia confertaspora ATCC 74209]|uniref:Uncharacterized protein n=1 Tax=Delitschia confertaspora ATCC 74209 TaxID=1513339 RepID=A0A9P4JIV1_9PLEO|nr:hypothetical protein GQ43DRAFT_444375 [Delitschia confertaspora ATCC 74209]